MTFKENLRQPSDIIEIEASDSEDDQNGKFIYLE